MRSRAAGASLFAVAAIAVGVWVSTAAATPTTLSIPAGLNPAVLNALNDVRAAHNLTPLTLNAELSRAATKHSQEMLVRGYFSHNSPDGSSYWKRIAAWYKQGAYSSWSVGENILFSSPEVDATHAVQWWMQSPGHRANILSAEWRQIGIAAIHADSAGGPFHNAPVTVITTDFGARS
ncbi:unannotated protein [freshwater metagenome]|uniref:Unannotated protein n=1 Tax=freshwater metagenome TaxID=449393 RepID=A0A6J6PWD0_9ZZZZ